jgi:hypothetical protein
MGQLPGLFCQNIDRLQEYCANSETPGIDLPLYRAGSLLAGTDTPESQILPGFVVAGVGLAGRPDFAERGCSRRRSMSPRAETGIDWAATGKLADLVILSADPTADIRNARRIERLSQRQHLAPAQLLKLVPRQ